MNVVKGEVYQTVGGWKAEVIWICHNDSKRGFYAIHHPNIEEVADKTGFFLEEDESVPIYHREDGTAHSALSVNSPPRFGKPHPADILGEIIEQRI